MVEVKDYYDTKNHLTAIKSLNTNPQIEEYIQVNYGGKVIGAYGCSQGGLMLTELLTRNKIDLGTVIMDGCYVAHQGKVSGWVTYKMFCKFKNTGKFPALIMLMMKLSFVWHQKVLIMKLVNL